MVARALSCRTATCASLLGPSNFQSTMNPLELERERCLLTWPLDTCQSHFEEDAGGCPLRVERLLQSYVAPAAPMRQDDEPS